MGLACFSFAQLFYSIGHLADLNQSHTIISKYIVLNIPCVLYVGYIIYQIENLGENIIIIYSYMLLLLIALITANSRYYSSHFKSYFLTIIGFIFFIFSCFMNTITITRLNQYDYSFAMPVEALTYYLAQYLIVCGCLEKRIIKIKKLY